MLPLVGNALLVRGWSAPAKDLWMARVSLVLLAAGAVTIALAGTRAVVTLGIVTLAAGSGYAYLMRSLMASLVAVEHTGLLYTVTSIFEAVGGLIAGPMLAQLFRIGLSWGGGWIGLPYFAAGLTCMVSLLVVSLVRPPMERGV